MLPISKVQDLITKHALLEKELSSGNVDKKKFAEKSKEYSDLNEIIKEANDYTNFKKNKDDLIKIIDDGNSDKDIKDLAILELDQLEKNNEINEKKLNYFYYQKMKQMQKMQY